MELRTLRYFLAAAGEGNMTRAAEILHVSQPTLSRQLMDLERELGATLVLRGKKGLTLTEDGLFFRQRAEEIVELADRLERGFAERDDRVSGTISVGASEAIGSRTLARWIREFSEKYPLVQFQLYNETANDIQDRLDKGLSDVGLLLEPVDAEKYEYLPMAQKETWGVLVRRDHPLADREKITPEEIRENPLILPLREKVREDLLRWIGREESRLRIPAGYSILSNGVLLVAEGMGCAFCLDGALAAASCPNLKFIPLSPEKTTRSVLLWKKNRIFSPAAALFIQEISRAVRERVG